MPFGQRRCQLPDNRCQIVYAVDCRIHIGKAAQKGPKGPKGPKGRKVTVFVIPGTATRHERLNLAP